MVVEATAPLVWVSVSVLEYPEPDEVETSKPVGAVNNMFAVKPLPDTVKLCAVEAEPDIVTNADNVPVAVMVGPET